MTTYHVVFNDERGTRDLEATDVVTEDGVYEFWRDDDVFLRVSSAEVTSIDPPARQT